MAQRITIMLDEELVKRLRNTQAKMIKDSGDSVSFSKVVNQILKKCFKN